MFSAHVGEGIGGAHLRIRCGERGEFVDDPALLIRMAIKTLPPERFSGLPFNDAISVRANFGLAPGQILLAPFSLFQFLQSDDPCHDSGLCCQNLSAGKNRFFQKASAVCTSSTSE